MSVQGEGLGIYFMGAIFSDVDSLILYSGIHRKVGDYHRMLSKRFPFAVYYKLNGPVVEVWRILDCRQDPKKTKRALE
jgi:hypothetical protein